MPVFLAAGAALGGFGLTAVFRVVGDFLKERQSGSKPKVKSLPKVPSFCKVSAPDAAAAAPIRSSRLCRSSRFSRSNPDLQELENISSEPLGLPQAHEEARGEIQLECQDSEEVDFEVWVETDLEASWCLEGAEKETQDWRGECQTSSILRTWDEFEALLEQKKGPNATGSRSSTGLLNSQAWRAVCPKQALASLKVLGLPEGSSEEQVRAAFRRLCLASHPDKGGSNAKFEAVLDAYRVLTASSCSKDGPQVARR
ncbi:unnamed protein product [Polarella glacialis]|uniref:J domain-containing protein n=1 Tax=Polarella glacialis TaxID=89957 RepID=A0A813EUC3_POLGL|nr:unnamed protein product [Polarella glacialis]